MTSCLVLDMGYQPHKVISWQRAVTLILDLKAEILKEYDEPLMTKEQAKRADASGWTVILKIPAVIRLLQKVSRKRAVRFSRMNVLARDQWQCQYCGRKLPTNKLNYDHVIPRSQGGKTIWENIVTSCYECNEKKENRTPKQAGMTLRNTPVRPKSLPIIAMHFDNTTSVPEAWRDFLYWNIALEEG